MNRRIKLPEVLWLDNDGNAVAAPADKARWLEAIAGWWKGAGAAVGPLSQVRLFDNGGGRWSLGNTEVFPPDAGPPRRPKPINVTENIHAAFRQAGLPVD